jgi:MFS family permease
MASPSTKGSGSAGAGGGRAGARKLAPIAFVNAVGNGLFFSISALFFTRTVGITTTQLGIGLTVGGVCGALASVPVGHLAERWGPKRVTIVLWLVEAVGMLAYTRVHSFAVFLPLVCFVVMADRSVGTGYRVLIAQGLASDDRARARSYLRAVANTGMGAGAAIGAAALQFDRRSAYVAAILVNAVSFVVAAVMLSRLTLPQQQEQTATAAEGKPAGVTRLQVLRDRPYLAVTVLSMILTLQFGLLEIGLPLWVAQRTKAPHAVVGAALVINTAVIAVLQMRLSKGSENLDRAARLCRRSGLLLAAGCLVFAVAAGVPAWFATVVVLTAVALQTFAEMYFSIGTMALSYDLVPSKGSGVYHGVFQSGYVIALLLSPLVITNSALRFGVGGWVALAVLFAAAGSLMVPVGRLAQRGREDSTGRRTPGASAEATAS